MKQCSYCPLSFVATEIKKLEACLEKETLVSNKTNMIKHA